MSKTAELTFQHIENSVVILNKGGIQSQHEAYLRRGEVFAKMGSGFVGLRRHGTSKAGVNVVDWDLGGQETFVYSPTGRVVIEDHPDAGEEDASTKISTALPEPTEEVTTKKRTRKK
ncbi:MULTISPECIES: hypothetical protein [Pseudomonadota]|uniref:hypothetical protein n=1 Tax=Pseudomonadota TaxID=1224 RepID=UPI00261D554A|nr:MULTISPECIES: hypothetical protein [Pseudomonadota]